MNRNINLQYNINFPKSRSGESLENCIIYVRQSTTDQKSLDEQSKACEDYAASRGFNNASVLMYKGSAWKGGNFDKLQDYLSKLTCMHTTTLFVYDVSRFTRDVKSALKMIEMLDDFKITIVSVVDGTTWNNTRKSQEQFMEKMLEAQKFSTALSERIIRKNQYLAERGAKFGNPPYGFKAVKNEEGIRKFVKNDEEMYVIAMIHKRRGHAIKNFDPVIHCYSELFHDFDKIAAELNSLQYYKRGREWDGKLVEALTKKPEFKNWAEESMHLVEQETEVVEHSICCDACQKWVVCEKEFADVMSNPSCQYICPECMTLPVPVED